MCVCMCTCTPKLHYESHSLACTCTCISVCVSFRVPDRTAGVDGPGACRRGLAARLGAAPLRHAGRRPGKPDCTEQY